VTDDRSGAASIADRHVAIEPATRSAEDWNQFQQVPRSEKSRSRDRFPRSCGWSLRH
jgi:hypothetical protein